MSFDGTVINGIIVLDEDNRLPEGVRVEVIVKEPVIAPFEKKPTLLGLLKMVGTLDDLPADFASEHDHYIHGTPKTLQQGKLMAIVFADSFYFFALGNRNDMAHAKALAFSQSYGGRIVTTGFVLTEFGDGCATPPHRRTVLLQAVNELRNNPDAAIVPCAEELFQAGLDLFEHRPDKEWSLTDCISFVVMQREGITEALTGDRHFEQAGFVALLK